MKKTIFTLILAAACTTAMFALEEQTKMVVVQKDGTIASYLLDDIDSVYFETTSSAPKVYNIEIPTDFSTGNVQKVMVGNEQVAEACLEYVRSWVDGKGNVVDDVLTVVYPMGADGKADLSRGIANNGASIVWDLEGDSIASYTPGEKTITSVFLSSDGEYLPELPSGAKEVATTLTPYLLQDNRSKTDKQTYKVVKIGVQYWMASNLKAVTMRDGSAITLYSSAQADAWSEATTPAYHIYTDDTEYCWPDYGAMYNGYAVVSEAGLAPEGWEVSSVAQWQAMKDYLRSGQSTKIKTLEYWTKPGSNLTGLSISPAGYFSHATGDDMEGTSVYYWTTDKTTTYGLNALYAAYIVNGITLTSTHIYDFGHYVRCIRK